MTYVLRITLFATLCLVGLAHAQADRLVAWSGRYGSTVIYDTNTDTWTSVSGSPAIGSSYPVAMAYDAESDRVVAWSGRYGSTLTYDVGTDIWTSVSGGPSIGSSYPVAMVYDAESDLMVAWSGRYGSTVTYDTNTDTWTTVSGSPSIGSSYPVGMAYDAESDLIVAWSGRYGSTVTYDTNTDTWTTVSGSPAVGSSYPVAMAYDVESDRVIAYSGRYGSTLAYDTNTDTWTTMTGGPSIGSSYPIGMAYDAESDRVIAWSGRYGSTIAYDYNTDTWTTVTGSTSIGSSYPVGLAYAGPIWPNAPVCTLTAPAGGSLSGDTLVAFDVTTPAMNDAVAAFSFSTDGGSTFTPATGAPGGTLAGNPSMPFPAGSHSWMWDVDTDLPLAYTGVVLRVTTSDAVTGYRRWCQTTVDVDNLPQCTLTSPAMGARLSGATPLFVSTTVPSGNDFTALMELSTDGGVSYAPATDGAGGTLLGNPTPASPAGSYVWEWATHRDVPTLASGVLLRTTVTDASSGASTSCEESYDIDNVPVCTIDAPASGSTIAGLTTLQLTLAIPSGDPCEAEVEWSSDGGVTFTRATDAGGGTLVGNPTSPVPGGAHTWQWDTSADASGMITGALVRVTVTDTVSGVSSTCERAFNVDNTIYCTVTAPAGIQRGAVMVDTTETTMAMPAVVDLVLEWSPAGMGTWSPCSMTSTSPNPNPLGGTAAGAHAFEWDSLADGAALGGQETIELRASAMDAVASTTCVTTVELDNGVQCTVSAPAGVSIGAVAIDVTEMTSASAVDVTVEWSPAGVGAWQPCTMAPGSAHPNPLTGAPAGAHVFLWDSRADGAALMGQETIELRAQVQDGSSTTSCTTTADIDNGQLCGTFCGDCDGNGLGPAILDALEASRIAASIVTPTSTQRGCCDTNSSGTIDVLDVLFIAQFAAGLPATLSCP